MVLMRVMGVGREACIVPGGAVDCQELGGKDSIGRSAASSSVQQW
jgi:hypothetical protein